MMALPGFLCNLYQPPADKCFKTSGLTLDTLIKFARDTAFSYCIKVMQKLWILNNSDNQAAVFLLGY